MRSTVAAGLAAAFGAALACIGAAQAATTLNYVTYKPQGTDPQASTTQWFADEVAKRTNGEYKVRIHWGGSVAGINEIPNAIENGVGDLGDVVTPYFPDQLLVNNAVSYYWPQPNSPIELGHLMENWHKTIPQFSAELAKYNMKLLGVRPLETYGMICTRPIKTLADLKGLRIRSYGFALPAVIKALGGVPVSLGTPETYEALERKIVDCAPIGITLAHGWKYDEVAKYFIEMPLGATWGHLIAMNMEKFNALPKNVQTALLDIGKEYLPRYCDALNAAEQEIRKRWADTGKVEVIQFPAAEFTKVIAKDPGIQAVRDEWVKRAKAQGVDTAPIVDALSFH